MSNQDQQDNSMILQPRQQWLQKVRDEMAPGEQPAAIVPRTFAEVMTMCDALARASIAPKHLRGNPVEMAMVVMTGLEVGLPPMASLRLYTTWDGVPRLMAEGVRGIILMRSTTIEYFEMATCDDNHATWIGKRRGRPEKSVTWTLERAKRAGLLSKDVWQKYPQDMLNARASMQLGRIIAPDVVAGMVALEEARDGDFIDVQGTEAKPQFVAPPPPQGPPPGVSRVDQVSSRGPFTVTAAPEAAVRAAVDEAKAAEVTVTDTGTKPAEQKRGPGRPPKDKTQPSETPGTDPFRRARENVDAREAARAERPADPTKDRWGQPIADPTPAADGASRESSPAATDTQPTASSSNSETSSANSPGSSSGASEDGFGGEDPQDSEPAPTGDPGLQLIEDLKAFLAGCKSQTEMQNGRPPFARRSEALNAAGDKRFKAYDKTGPAGEMAAEMGRIWADRKRQLPV